MTQQRPDLAELAHLLRTNPSLRAKAEIALVTDVLGDSDWISGPGDDGALVSLCEGASAGHAVACGEALLPRFVQHDPYGAGLAAVVANVNDIAAMGAIPRGLVDTIVGSRDVAREILRGLRTGCEIYRIPLVGGHLTITDGAPALSAFGLGWTGRALSATHAAVGQHVVLVSCTDGTMRADFPFFASFDERGDRLGDDVRLLAAAAEDGACVAAKDVSMAGTIGSLAMLLEPTGLGVTVDIDAIPRPAAVEIAPWLMCFPAFSFLLCAPADRVDDCTARFTTVGLQAASIGVIDSTGVVAIRQDDRRETVLDLTEGIVTGLTRRDPARD